MNVRTKEKRSLLEKSRTRKICLRNFRLKNGLKASVTRIFVERFK